MNVTRNEKTISVKTYLGQVSKSIDKVKKSIANDITNGLTFSSKRLLENNILNFSISGEKAFLFNENDEEIITLTRPLNESLVNSWDMISLRTQNAISYSILDSDFKIIFFENGTIRVTTSCNGGGGSFKIQNNNLSFLDLFFTEKACEPERNLREKEFSEALQSVNKFSVIRDKLKLMRDNEVWITFEKS